MAQPDNMDQAHLVPTPEQLAKRGEALLERFSDGQRASHAQYFAALFVLLLACGLAFGATVNDAMALSPVSSKVSSSVVLSNGEEDTQVAKSSRFCIFGVDDLKLRPSAARGVDEKRSPAHFENGDCWMDKPGQMA